MAFYFHRDAMVAIVLILVSMSASSPAQQQVLIGQNLATILKQTQATVKALENKVKQLMEDRVMLLRGRDGRDGRDGPPGPKGALGSRGERGPQGPKGDRSGGLQYVRWGRTSCPSSAQLVYKGTMAGEHYTHPGGGVNYLCLVENPVYANHKPGHQNGGYLYTTEYEVNTFNPFSKNLHDHDAPCAVCYVSNRSTKLMMPGTNVCPAGWSRDYHGYLMTEHRSHAHPRDFICMDRDPEAIRGSHGSTNGALLYPVEGVCGHGVPCGPYVAGKELTCAICSI